MNFVLGTSLTGLIVARILGWPAIGGDVGGRSKAPFPLGPMILEKTEDTEWLLDNLGIEPGEPSTYIVGYYQDNKVLGKAPEGFKEAYYAKTRGDGTPTISVMTGGRDSLVGWDIKGLGLLDKLKKTVKALDNPAKSISPYDKMIYLEGSIMKYDNLVSTIPMPKFLELTGDKRSIKDFESWGTNFVHTTLAVDNPNNAIIKFLLAGPYDYIYVADPSYAFHRATRVGPSEIVFEFREDRSPVVPDEVIQTEACFIPNCQILPYRGNTTFQRMSNIDLIGRYAEWDHKIKLEKVIRRAREYASSLR
jgi:hypothetical protein